MKRKFFTWVVGLVLSFTFIVPATFALDCTDSRSKPQFSVLPATDKTYDECRSFMIEVEALESDEFSFTMKTCRNDVLACGINTGKIGLWMVPYFITYIVNFLLGLAGLICVLFIVIGGYRYVVGGLTEEKEKGKHTIRDALIGMVVALLAWTIINVIINAITG